jgi:NADPH-dependent 2,4-dienoyl-CoA reductase/sulfur reductase-like enzyme
VDEYQETNLRGVFAAGDCAEVRHMVTGRPVLIPLGTTANKTGRVAGANAAGARERFPGVVGTGILSLFGLGIGFAGLSASQAKSDGIQAVSERIQAREKPRYFQGRVLTVELVAERSTGRLLGGTVTGEGDVKGHIDVIATAVSARMTLDQFQWMDLSYAPPFATAWDPVLIAAQQLAKKA